MTTAAEVLTTAHSQIGTTEDPPGSNCQRFSRELGRPCEFWCADLVSWVLAKAGLDPRPDTPGVVDMLDWFARRHRYDSTPQVGDVAFLKTGNRHSGPTHVGLVVSVTRDVVVTIEGNTSDGDGGSQDNGGGVFQRHRTFRTSGPFPYFVGFGHPIYSTQEDELTPEQAQQLQAAAEAKQEAYEAKLLAGDAKALATEAVAKLDKIIAKLGA